MCLLCLWKEIRYNIFMFKRDKKLNTSVNTEIDQALSAINFTEFTAIDRPQKGQSKIKIFGLAVLLLGLLFGAIYFFREGSGLANYLPADTKFYASLSLPREPKWFDPLFFWSADTASGKSNQKIASIYSRLNLISWGEAAWAEKILPLLAGRLELAILPGAEGEGAPDILVARATLKDRAAWLKLFGYEASYNGEVLTRDLLVSGAWGALTKNPNKIVWRILGEDLYLADNADILKQMPSRPAETLSSQLRGLKAKPGLARVYIKDKDSLKFDNPYVRALSMGSVYPLVMGLKQSSGAININFYGQKLNSEPLEPGVLSGRLSEFGSSFYAQNLPRAYAQAEAYLPEGLKNNFWAILKDFYGISQEEALTEFGASEIFLTFFGDDWLFNIANNGPENSGLRALLKKAGTALFAATHPAAVEHKLADGTKMIELRADVEGLDWGEEPWSYAGEAANFEALRGQGEGRGYYSGFAPGIGYILTTAMPLLNQYAVTGTSGENKSCVLSKNILLGVSWPVANLTNNDFWRSMVDKIVIASLADGKISGCAVLRD